MKKHVLIVVFTLLCIKSFASGPHGNSTLAIYEHEGINYLAHTNNSNQVAIAFSTGAEYFESQIHEMAFDEFYFFFSEFIYDNKLYFIAILEIPDLSEIKKRGYIKTGEIFLLSDDYRELSVTYIGPNLCIENSFFATGGKFCLGLGYSVYRGDIFITKLIMNEERLVLIQEAISQILYEDGFLFNIIDEGRAIKIIGGRTWNMPELQIPSMLRGRPVTVIGSRAFQSSRLSNVIIPDSVVYIESYAFMGNHITNVIIPSSVVYVGAFAFGWNSLVSITIGENVELEFGYWDSIWTREWWYSFSVNFDAFYKTNGSKAGTYIYNNGEWSRL